MLRARTTDGTAILGLDAENVRRLQAGQPIQVNLEQMGGAHTVLIVYGQTVHDIARDLEQASGAPLPPALRLTPMAWKRMMEAAMRDLTEDEVLGAIQSSASLEGRIKLTYESGPYDIDRPTNVAMIFAAAVQRKFREVNGIDGVPDTTNDQPKEPK